MHEHDAERALAAIQEESEVRGAYAEATRELEEARVFLRRTAMEGGSIVSSAAMTPTQIAIARAADRMLVTPDGYGFVYVPGPRFCACGRIESDCDQSRASCPRTDHLLAAYSASVSEANRLRKLFDDAGQGEHNVLALIDHYQRNSMDADERLRAVRKLLEENGCECPCDHHPDERGDECDLCLACRIGEAVGK